MIFLRILAGLVVLEMFAVFAAMTDPGASLLDSFFDANIVIGGILLIGIGVILIAMLTMFAITGKFL